MIEKENGNLGLLRKRDIVIWFDVVQLALQTGRWNGDAKARVDPNVKL